MDAEPGTALHYFERGRAFLLHEMIDSARADLATTLKLDPYHHHAAALLSHLTSGTPMDPLQPFPPQKKIVRGQYTTTGLAKKEKHVENGLIVENATKSIDTEDHPHNRFISSAFRGTGRASEIRNTPASSIESYGLHSPAFPALNILSLEFDPTAKKLK